ncbi:hypothetical protein, partial [Bartonella phoceensis]|uniref:hypothetical protein n=1 Tax=Bartonella phoceensis TaxID=270249 RepID=UPI001ABA0A7A
MGADPEQEPIYESIPGIPTGAVGGAASPRSRTPDLGADPEQEPIYEAIPCSFNQLNMPATYP